LGVIDVLAADGQGEREVQNWMRRNERRGNALRGVYGCRQVTNPVTREELDAITDIWVDRALQLQDKDLKMMSRVVRSQLKRIEAARGDGDACETIPRLHAVA
jgi:DSF synthase